METMTLKERVKGNVKFKYYRENELWYETHDGFLFPVPINDTGNATFKDEDKGILFMRWIRKYMEALQE
jgi:hypothetical protein